MLIFSRCFSNMVDFGTPFEIRWGQKSAPGPRKDPAERVCAVFASRCFPILHCTLPHITFSFVISLGKCICRSPCDSSRAKRGGFGSRGFPNGSKNRARNRPFFQCFFKFSKNHENHQKPLFLQWFLNVFSSQNGSKIDQKINTGRALFGTFFRHRFA